MTVINVEQASIRTATVTIKALTVDGRQVTQALFRQLIAEPIIDPSTGTLRGTPWGTVNYHPDKCADDRTHLHDDRTHLHVVWQRGDELRRAREPRPPDTISDYAEAGDDWADALVLTGWRPRNDRYGLTALRLAMSDGPPSLRVDLSVTARKLLDAATVLDGAKSQDGRIDFAQHRYDQARTALVERVGASTEADLRAEVLAERDADRRRHAACWESWQRLIGLDQLFIAV